MTDPFVSFDDNITVSVDEIGEAPA